MDGVLANLDDAMNSMFYDGIMDEPEEVVVHALRKFTDCDGFFALNPMPYAHRIADFVRTHRDYVDFQILTSHGSFYEKPEVVAEQKQEWLWVNFYQDLYKLPFYCVHSGKAKAEWSEPNCFLIDDTKKVVEEFNKGDGQAFLYSCEKHDDVFDILTWIIENETLRKAV